MKITNFSLDHGISAYVLTLMIVIAGIATYLGMPREAAPDITIPVVVVSTPYFGVTPEDIETLVTQPIEKELKSLKGVDEMRSTSAEGVSIVTVVFEPDVEIDDALQKMREKVDKAKPELPPDAEDPILTEINFSEFPIMLVNVHGDVDPVMLKNLAEDMEDELEQVDGVLDVTLAGGVEREIQVQVDPEKLTYYKVSIHEINGALQREHINLPGGSVDVGSLKYLVRVDGEFKQAQPLEEIVIREEKGQPIKLKDVAQVVDGYKDAESYSRFRGHNNVSLSIQKRAGENLLRITDDTKAILEKWEEKLPKGVEITVTADVSDQVHEQVKDLVNNIYTGLILVVLILLFFMGGVRNSLFVASAIPLSMLLSFIVLDTMGVTLNMVVLFSLVLALGMLGDNGIVIVENIYRHYSMGKERMTAARDGVAEVAWPIISSTATTVAAFLPMLFWPGVMGKFMGFLPLTVIIVLTASLFVALIINPVICASFMVRPKSFVDEESVPDNFVYRGYRRVLDWSLNHRWAVVGLSLLSFVGTFAIYGALQHGVEFFPETTPSRAFLTVRAPEGTHLGATDRLSRDVEGELAKFQNLDSYVVSVGVGGGGNDISPGSNQPNRAQMTIEFKEGADAVEDPFATLEHMRQMLSGKTGAEFQVDKENMGPPGGKPINLEIVGEDFHTLGALSRQIRQDLVGVEGLVDVKDNYIVGRPELHVVVERDRAALVGANTQQIAGTVRAAINGTEAIKLRDGQDEIPVLVRLKPDDRRTLEDVAELTLPGRDGAQIPLREVARLETRGGSGSIRHLDRDRVITIEGNVSAGMLPNDVLAKVQDKLATFEMPKGYQIRYTGQNKEQQEAQVFLGKALAAGVFMIMLILVLQFNSVLQTLTIMTSVTLSLIGVLWGLLITETPFGVIMVGIAVISLAGVVVNNAIVLIDFINQLRARGMERHKAALLAGLTRLRPVMLTAGTTILGLIPMSIGVSYDFIDWKWAFGGRSVEMWGSMANAMNFGLGFATVLTLVVVPVVYTLMDDLSNFFGKLAALPGRLWARLRRKEAATDDGAGIQGSRQEAFAGQGPNDSL